MQERYLGDSHDFVKYALLRFLYCRLHLRIGVNWYLTRPEGVDAKQNRDGEKRHHMKRTEWRSWDQDLFEQLKHFKNMSERRIEHVQHIHVLPKNTIYFTKEVPTKDRNKWHDEAKNTLKKAGLIFMDPDNGFQVQSMTNRTSPKYAFYDEVIDYFQGGKSVIVIQFARQINRSELCQNVRERLGGRADKFPIIRGRVAPNILFFTLGHSEHAGKLKEAISMFASNSPQMHRSRPDHLVELIP